MVGHRERRAANSPSLLRIDSSKLQFRKSESHLSPGADRRQRLRLRSIDDIVQFVPDSQSR